MQQKTSTEEKIMAEAVEESPQEKIISPYPTSLGQLSRLVFRHQLQISASQFSSGVQKRFLFSWQLSA